MVGLLAGIVAPYPHLGAIRVIYGWRRGSAGVVGLGGGAALGVLQHVGFGRGRGVPPRRGA